MKIILYLIFLISLSGCRYNSATEKYQKRTDKIVDVKDRVQEIVIDSPLIASWARICILSDYLIISDHQSRNHLIHIFDKRNFSCLAGVGHSGEGPDEITSIGITVPDERHRRFYVSDNGKRKILSYNLDSVLANPSYLPEHKVDMRDKQFPDRFVYIDDTLCIARSIIGKENEVFRQELVKWNMKTGEMKPLFKGHPEIERKRTNFAVSLKDSLIVECYIHHDLMTIHDFNGNLKCNIYGSKWDNRMSNEMTHYGDVFICRDKIIAAYAGGHNWSDEQFAKCLLVYDLEGNYVKTLNVGYKICHFCYDQDTNRIIMYLEDEIQFAYLDMDGLL